MMNDFSSMRTLLIEVLLKEIRTKEPKLLNTFYLNNI